MSDRVFILGAGRAGQGLARALRASGVDLVGLHGRHVADGSEQVTAGAIPNTVREATAVLVTVRDSQLDMALAELAAAPLAAGAVVLHASGSAEPETIEQLRRRGHPAGTFHPLVPLADPARAADMLMGAFIGIDGDDRARATALELAARLGATTVAIPPGTKARYHAAAVIASNFPAVLFAVAERQLAACGFEPGTARSVVQALMSATIENLRDRSGAEALTGPIVRGDVETVRRHLHALTADPEALEVYRALSRAALGIARAVGTEEGAIRQMSELFD